MVRDIVPGLVNEFDAGEDFEMFLPELFQSQACLFGDVKTHGGEALCVAS